MVTVPLIVVEILRAMITVVMYGNGSANYGNGSGMYGNGSAQNNG
jgi:hypothetical protein